VRHFDPCRRWPLCLRTSPPRRLVVTAYIQKIFAKEMSSNKALYFGVEIPRQSGASASGRRCRRRGKALSDWVNLRDAQRRDRVYVAALEGVSDTRPPLPPARRRRFGYSMRSTSPGSASPLSITCADGCSMSPPGPRLSRAMDVGVRRTSRACLHAFRGVSYSRSLPLVLGSAAGGSHRPMQGASRATVVQHHCRI
jgi:hypothetical protein